MLGESSRTPWTASMSSQKTVTSATSPPPALFHSSHSSGSSASRASTPFPAAPGTFLDLSASFENIVWRWRSNSLTPHDHKMLSGVYVSDANYRSLADTFRLRHGIELMNNRIVFNEVPGTVHEVVSRLVDKWVWDSFPVEEMMVFGSAGILSFTNVLIFRRCLQRRRSQATRCLFCSQAQTYPNSTESLIAHAGHNTTFS
jgi:hypothetical protein